MDIEIIKRKSPLHKGVCTALVWSNTNELFSVGDDRQIHKWSVNGEPRGSVSQLNVKVTSMDWLSLRGKGGFSGSSKIILGCSNGDILLIFDNGKIDKRFRKKHKGAILSIKWTRDGNAFFSSGEDGRLLFWTRSVTLRSNIASHKRPIYALDFNATNEKVVYGNEGKLYIRKVREQGRAKSWKAHRGSILSIDWHPLHHRIVTGGEEGIFKIWDKFGRVIHISTVFEHPITRVAFSPSGNNIGIGSFNLILVADKNGTTNVRKMCPDLGSPFALTWTRDGTRFACGGGTGRVFFAKILCNPIEWNEYIVTCPNSRQVKVKNIINDSTDTLEYHDDVVHISLKYGTLVVVTSTQCYIYPINALTSQHVLDLSHLVYFLLQTKRYLCLVDVKGLHLFTYDTRPLPRPNIPSLQASLLDSRRTISVCDERIAVIDTSSKGKGKIIRVVPVGIGGGSLSSSKSKIVSIPHSMTITEVSLSPRGNILVFIDRNRDLYLASLTKSKPKSQENTFSVSGEIVKLDTMVDSVIWNDSCDMLCSISDGQLVCWIYPMVMYIDRDLIPNVKMLLGEDLGRRGCEFVSFQKSRITVLSFSGTKIPYIIPSYFLLLFELAERRKWKEAIRICRYVKDNKMWACLSLMSIQNSEFNTAEVALAAIEQIEKLQYILSVKKIPSKEGRMAEMELYRNRVEKAEQILIQADLIYRAIKMNIRKYRWERALELARNYNVHIDTVIYHRRKYLEIFQNGEESNPVFLRYQDMEIVEKEIKEKIEKEKELERERRGSAPLI